MSGGRAVEGRNVLDQIGAAADRAENADVNQRFRYVDHVGDDGVRTEKSQNGRRTVALVSGEIRTRLRSSSSSLISGPRTEARGTSDKREKPLRPT